MTDISIDEVANQLNVSNNLNKRKCSKCDATKEQKEFESISPPRKVIGNGGNERENIPRLVKLCRSCQYKKKVSNNSARNRRREAAKASRGTWFTWEEVINGLETGFATLFE
jgi:hypothetical protein